MTKQSPGAVQQVIFMGVAGCGKTTIADEVAARTGWTRAEGDEFHSEANVTKMSSGTPLTDEDRWPWLRSIGDWMSTQIAAGRSSAVTCSALRRVYRDLLREGRPEVRFCHLHAPFDVIAERMASRHGHYMPLSLLRSQFAILEPLEPDEPGVEVRIDGDPHTVTARVLDALGISAVNLDLSGAVHREEQP